MADASPATSNSGRTIAVLFMAPSTAMIARGSPPASRHRALKEGDPITNLWVGQPTSRGGCAELAHPVDPLAALVVAAVIDEAEQRFANGPDADEVEDAAAHRRHAVRPKPELIDEG